MTTEPSPALCIICGLPELPRNPMWGEGLDEEFPIHAQCYNSPGARRWRNQRCADDPTYARFMQLITSRLPVTCPHCQFETEQLPREAINASWRVSCTHCHRLHPRDLPPYSETGVVYSALASLCGDFIRSRNLDQIEQQVLEVARTHDHLLNAEPCECGGSFSLATKARCPHCDRVATDSYFHVLVEPLTPQMRQRLKELFGV